MTSRIPPSALAFAILLFALLAAPRQAAPEPAAAIAPSGSHSARISFERFAASWMEKLHKLELANQRSPKAAPAGGRSPHVTYRGYGSEFGTELRPTGHPKAPYVGILRYEEHLYACADVRATRCSIRTRTPVTELFRYESGRWIY